MNAEGVPPSSGAFGAKILAVVRDPGLATAAGTGGDTGQHAGPPLQGRAPVQGAPGLEGIGRAQLHALALPLAGDFDAEGVDHGGAVNVLTSLHWTPVSKGNCQHTTLVQIKKA